MRESLARVTVRTSIAVVGGMAIAVAVLPTSGAGAAPDTSAPRSATPVMVDPGKSTSGIDATLSAEAGISGTLTQQVDGTKSPVADPVAAVGSDGKILAQAFSGRDGAFTLLGISLDGRSSVHVCTGGDGYAGSPTVVDGGCAGGTTGWHFGDKPSGRSVPISAGAVSSGVDVVSFTHQVPANYYGTVDATVKGSDGKALDGWWMGIINARTGEIWGEDGSNQVPPGNYRVCIASESNGFGSGPIAARTGGYVDTCYGGVTWWHAPGQDNVPGPVPKAATIVHVSSGQTLNLKLTLPRAGGISGSVREQNRPHKVVRDGIVRVWHGNDLIRVGGANFEFIRLPAGRYTVCAGGGRAMPGKVKCWKAGGWKPSATPKPNSANVSVAAARIHRNVNFALPGGFRYGAISGRVVGPNGAPLSGVRISAALDGDPSVLPRRSRTDRNGRYTISGLIGFRHARYRVSFGSGPRGLLPDYPPQYPTPIRVSPGRTSIGIGTTMHKPGRVTGTVTDVHDDPISGADAIVLSKRGHELAYAMTGDDGTYTLTGLAATRRGYTICFYGGNAKSPTGYQPQCFDGVDWDG